MGAKRRVNGTSKVNRQTDRQKDRQTHIWTNRLIENIGPEGQWFENNKSMISHVSINDCAHKLFGKLILSTNTGFYWDPTEARHLMVAQQKLELYQ